MPSGWKLVMPLSLPILAKDAETRDIAVAKASQAVFTKQRFQP
jgi:hypothetical protein